MNNSTDNHQQLGSLNMIMQRRWLQEHQKRLMSSQMVPSQNNTAVGPPAQYCKFLKDDEDDLKIAGVIPAVTVVVEGRSICHRISLDSHDGYSSLAKALRRMLVDYDGDDDQEVDLSNAIPGHIIAYEDMENDLLLAGDLNWKDFTRVAKRIRIIPVKGNSSKSKAFK